MFGGDEKGGFGFWFGGWVGLSWFCWLGRFGLAYWFTGVLLSSWGWRRGGFG
jgi:hypothetical protein